MSAKRVLTRKAAAASLVAACLAVAMPAWARIGWVENLQGSVQIEDASAASRALRIGDALEETARLRTGADGEVLIRFVDEALLAVRPNSQLELTRYRYLEGDRSSSSALQLLKGGMRFVTGLIGKLNRDQVQFNTPVATIGIRGTDFDAIYLDVREGDSDAGLYTCVTEGATFLQGEGGRRVDISQGQTAFATSADLIAQGLSNAREWGLIKPPPGLFRSGSFDGQLEELKQELLRRLQGKLTEKVPAQLREVVPTELIGGLFSRKKAESKKNGGGRCTG